MSTSSLVYVLLFMFITVRRQILSRWHLSGVKTGSSDGRRDEISRLIDFLASEKANHRLAIASKLVDRLARKQSRMREVVANVLDLAQPSLKVPAHRQAA